MSDERPPPFDNMFGRREGQKSWDDASSDEVIQDIRDFKEKYMSQPLLDDVGDNSMTGPEIEEEAENVGLAELLVSYSIEFDNRIVERHAMGATKYGAGAFLTADTLEMAIEEVLDLANYARYTFLKLRLLQESLREQVPDEPISTGFIRSADATALKEEK